MFSVTAYKVIYGTIRRCLMIPLFFFAFTDTVAIDIDYETVYVHEWGVIEVDMGFPTAGGAMWGYLDDHGTLEPYTGYAVEAPVVWFHGAQCTGTFTVRVNEGYFTILHPPPDSLWQEECERRASPGNFSIQTGIWRDVSLTRDVPEDEESLSVAYETNGFSWAIPFWRDVPANYVTVPGASYQDRFLYYECTQNTLGEYISGSSYGRRTYGYRGEALVFQEEDGEVTARRADVEETVTTLGGVLSLYEVLEIICGWSNNRLKSQEIQALWDTWEPALRQRCIREGLDVMIFPLSPEQVESISSIHFRPDGTNPVEYARLFLGLGAVDL